MPRDPRPESIYDAFVAPSARQADFDPRTSPLFERVAFIVGAPRSGTTWLQQLLFVHPDLVTGGESHLFCEGLPEVFANFAHPNGMSHLSTWTNRAELLTAARAFCDYVFETQRAAVRPDAHMVLEKTPNHRLQAALQAELYPDGRYVHIVRDGRDATSSQRELWGAVTAEFADPHRAAEAWAASVRDIRIHLGSLTYLELRYEDLVADPSGSLRKIFEHLGLEYHDGLVAAAIAFGRAPVHTSPLSPAVGIRKHAGDALAERAVARAAGDLLVELGYATPDAVAALRKLRASTFADKARRWRTRRSQKTASPEIVSAVTRLAEALVHDDTELKGARLAQRRIVGTSALLTFVTAHGKRVVLRVAVRDGTAVVVEAL